MDRRRVAAVARDEVLVWAMAGSRVITGDGVEMDRSQSHRMEAKVKDGPSLW